MPDLFDIKTGKPIALETPRPEKKKGGGGGGGPDDLPLAMAEELLQLVKDGHTDTFVVLLVDKRNGINIGMTNILDGQLAIMATMFQHEVTSLLMAKASNHEPTGAA